MELVEANRKQLESNQKLKELNEAFSAENSTLQKNEERYRIFFRNNQAGLWCYNIDPPLPLDIPQAEQIDWYCRNSQMVDCNDVYARLHGYYSREDLLGLSITEVGNRPKEFINEAINLWIEGGHCYKPIEIKVGNPSGVEKWGIVSGHSIREAGKIIRICGSLVETTDKKIAEEKLKKALLEIQELHDRLKAENTYLHEKLQERKSNVNIVGSSEALMEALSLAEMVARTNSTVLILGETGTGKELFADAILGMSFYKDNPLVVVNCASLPAALIESELFGHEKGAYTGALNKRIGRFELADGGTIFLDEIGELPMETQAKLLRVLEEGKFERLGGSKTYSIDVRIIAATNRDLEKLTAEGSFRKDLFYRLNVFPINLPPLRKRKGDIEALVWSFVKDFSRSMDKRVQSISKADIDALNAYSWPGNVRELRNVVERAMIAAEEKILKINLPKPSVQENFNSFGSMDEMQRQYILDVLDKTGGRIRGKHGAAEILKMKPTTLENRMAKLDIRKSS